jgi:DNA-binding CsgD family transcriptional regulator
MDLTLSPIDQARVHQLLLVAPEPGALLPRPAIEAIARLVPCDAVGVVETDHGVLLRAVELSPDGRFGPGYRCCDDTLPVGLFQVAAFPPDDEDLAVLRAEGWSDELRLGFSAGPGTVVQLSAQRDKGCFSERDVVMLRMLAPALGRLMRTGARLASTPALSASEHRVLELVAAGGSNRDVAEHLSVSVATVRKHLENTYRKLGVGSRTAAVAALREPAPVRDQVSRFG